MCGVMMNRERDMRTKEVYLDDNRQVVSSREHRRGGRAHWVAFSITRIDLWHVPGCIVPMCLLFIIDISQVI